jgi:hypothetical protein
MSLPNSFMDMVWDSIETVATKKIVDQKMREEQYLRNFAGMAFYYAHVSCNGYTHKFLGCSQPYSRMSDMTARNEKLIGWLDALEQEWGKSDYASKFIEEHPKAQVMRQVAMLGTLKHIIQARAWARNFRCDDPYMLTYVKIRCEFTEGRDGSPPAYIQMKERKTAQQFYNAMVNSTGGRFSKYVLSRYCGYEVAGKVDMTDYSGWMQMTPDEYEEREIRQVLFVSEIEALEEQVHGRDNSK